MNIVDDLTAKLTAMTETARQLEVANRYFAISEERLHAELNAQKELHAWEYTPAMAQAKIDQLNVQLTAMTEERDAVLRGGVTEEMLRRQDGSIHLAKGCCIVVESEWDLMLQRSTEAQQEIERLRKALEAVVKVSCETTTANVAKQALAGTKEGA